MQPTQRMYENRLLLDANSPHPPCIRFGTWHPHSAMAASSSSLMMLNILSTPSCPPTASEKKTGLPSKTAVAPRQKRGGVLIDHACHSLGQGEFASLHTSACQIFVDRGSRNTKRVCAARCWTNRMKGELHPLRALLRMDDSFE